MMNINLDMYEAKNKLFGLTAMVKGYPEIKTKVKAATNLDPWGPTQQQMQEICDACHGYEDRRLIMRALWKRITTSPSKEWPHVYKALAIFEYLLLHGPENIADEIRDQLYNLKTLHEFQATDEKGQDKGFAIREKSKKLVEWLTNSGLLAEERAKSAALQSKYVGISNSGTSTSTVPSSYSSPPTSYSSSSSAKPAAQPKRNSTDIEALQADEEYIQQQNSIMESIENSRRLPSGQDAAATNLFAGTSFDTPVASKPSPSPKPASKAAAKAAAPKAAAPKPAAPQPKPAPAPQKEELLFDPFGDLTPTPPPPKPPTDLNDFFASDPAPAQSAFDPFAAPAAPAQPPASAPMQSNAFTASQQQDLFATPPPDFGASNDLFASGDPFGGPASPSETTGAASGKKTVFQDATFDQLCALDKLSMNAPAPVVEAERRAPAQSLKAMKMQKSPTAPTSQDTYNPFL